MRTARLDEIVRQKDPALKEAVEQLASGRIKDAIGNLDRHGRIHEIEDAEKRLEEIARQYVTSSGRTLVVSPDNQPGSDLKLQSQKPQSHTSGTEAQVLSQSQSVVM